MGNLEKFNAAADQYDTPARVAMAQIITRALTPHLKDAKEKTLLDFGCGTGLMGLALADEVGALLLLDASPNMTRVVEEKIGLLGLKNARALCCNLEEEPPPGNLRADYILMVQVLLHIPEIAPLLAQLHGLLNPGGRLLLVDFDKNPRVVSPEIHNGFHQAALSALLESLGFCDVQSHTFYQGKNLLMKEDASLFLMEAAKG